MTLLDKIMDVINNYCDECYLSDSQFRDLQSDIESVLEEQTEVTPTPAELCQQLADLTGKKVEAVIDRKERCIVTLGGYIGPTYDGINMIQDNWACTKGHAFIISRPVSYTGRWQDSKVTATPREVKP